MLILKNHQHATSSIYDTFPCTTANLDAADCKAACCKNKVIDVCYFIFAFALDSVSVEDKMLFR